MKSSKSSSSEKKKDERKKKRRRRLGKVNLNEVLENGGRKGIKKERNESLFRN